MKPKKNTFFEVPLNLYGQTTGNLFSHGHFLYLNQYGDIKLDF